VISPSFLVGRRDLPFLAVCLDGAAWFLLCGGIFLNVLVGGDGGAEGPKELMGWVGGVTDDMVYPPPTPRFRGWSHSFLQHVEVLI